MKRLLDVSPQASDDLFEQSTYIELDNPTAAGDFIAAVAATFDRLAEYPELGRLYPDAPPTLSGLRVLPVDRYSNYLVFYLDLVGKILIVRVLHGAREIDRLL